ncbi:MAG: hydrogenase small subunit [Deltaproteobacteria bacterium]|nr:hydrogenase small subunit [Deltaproteobacteria bacterium]
MKKQEHEFYERLENKGVSRRDFMKFCTAVTAALGLSSSMVVKVSEALAQVKQRPSVVWLHFAECTGCSESFLRTTYPYVADILFDVISLDYHETIMAAAGHQAEENLEKAVRDGKGKFICIVEGAIPTGDTANWGVIAGRTFQQIGEHVCKNALATICVGACATYGGVQAAKPNPGNFKGVGEALGIKPINVAGCPPNPINMVAVIVHYLLLGKLPDLDSLGRPLFAYGKTIHDQCPRRSHYESGEFVKEFGSKEAAQGWCLYEMGCKGPDTYNNCPLVKFNEGTSWPVQAGHPCIGCSEPDFWDKMAPFYMSKEAKAPKDAKTPKEAKAPNKK